MPSKKRALSFWCLAIAATLYFAVTPGAFAQTRLLEVKSCPTNGFGCYITPLDIYGNGNGITDFNRFYANGTNVQLTAATGGGVYFVAWWLDGQFYSYSATINLTMNAQHTLMMEYSECGATLSVNSSNPSSGAYVSVSPPDKNGATGGTTPFTRKYRPFQNIVVTLTANTPVGGNDFSHWHRDGADACTQVTCTVTMSSDHNMTAVYVTPTRTLNVGSSNPNNGVSITVSPSNCPGGTTTPFSCTYSNNTVVNLTAPATAQGNNFSKWQRNGADWSTNPIAPPLTMDADYTLTAVYVTPTRTLNVGSSNPNNGVSITVSPSNCPGGTITPFSCTYSNNTVVNLTAPATAQGNNFSKWQRNGADWSTNPIAPPLTMDADYTLTAVYVTPTRTLNVGSSNPNNGVLITVSPSNCPGGTITPFSCTYSNNTVVNLTAPATAQGNNFSKWQRNGADWSTNPIAPPLTMDADYNLIAVYGTPIRTLNVGSSNPNNGVSITVSPSNCPGGTTTPFSCTYSDNTVVNLTAPATAQGKEFFKWQRNGADWSTNPIAPPLTMNADYTLTAVYIPPPEISSVVIFPVPAEIGSNATIQWSSIGNTGSTVKVEVYKGSTWVTVALNAPNSDGPNSWNWLIPNGNMISSQDWVGSNRLVRVTSNLNPLVYGTSEPFTIEGFIVTLPNGGESWNAGKKYSIAWTKVGGYTLIQIDLSIDNGASWTQLTEGSGISADGPHVWDIPSGITPGIYNAPSCLIRIRDALRSGVNDISNAIFSIHCGAGYDTDGDAIPDVWECNGYDPNNDGTVEVPLPQMGSTPYHKDIFVEVDWLAQGPGDKESHAFKPAARDKVVAMFANAPVSNPDLTTGINLHIDAGQGGYFNEGNEIPYDQDLEDLNPWQDEFNDLKATHFSSNRVPIFHYCIFGHQYDGGDRTGVAYVLGSDLLVTLGPAGGYDTYLTQAGTFAHELGHNLGLYHGGADDANYVPNYLSIMSYTYQLSGLIINYSDGHFDYSRWGSPELPALNELQLNEAIGLNGPSAINSYLVRYWCDVNSPYSCGKVLAFANSAIDWNCDGYISASPVSQDVGGFLCDRPCPGSPACGNFKSTLFSYNDWDALVYASMPPPRARASAEKLVVDPPIELSYEQYLTFAILHGDMDDSKICDNADVVSLIQYILRGGQEPYPLYRADVNCDQRLDLLDVAWMINFVFRNGMCPCADIIPRVDPGAADQVRIGKAKVSSVSGNVTVSVPVYVLWDEQNVPGITVPVWVKSGAIHLDTALFADGFAETAQYRGFRRDSSDPNKALLWACDTIGNFAGNGNERLFATLRITVPAGTPAQCAVIDTVQLPPSNELLLADDQGHGWTPGFVTGRVDILNTCGDCDCSGFCDLDLDGGINPMDVVIMVNYVYKQHDQRQQIETCYGNNGDWDCSGSVNPIDVVKYVNFVYKSSGQSCDPCAQ